MKLLLFDVDATLVLTGGAGLRALNRAFHQLFALDNAMNNVAPHGKTDPAIVREIFQKNVPGRAATEPLIATVLEKYVKFLSDEVEHSQTTQTYQVLPGILEILEAMADRHDVLLGLATGNIEMGARIKLRPGNLNRYFEFGGYGSDAEDRVTLVRHAAQKAASRHGASIDADSIHVIGDTPLDVDAGRKAGFRTIGVATGQYSVNQLREAGADFAIANFHEGRDYFLRSTFIE